MSVPHRLTSKHTCVSLLFNRPSHTSTAPCLFLFLSLSLSLSLSEDTGTDVTINKTRLFLSPRSLIGYRQSKTPPTALHFFPCFLSFSSFSSFPAFCCSTVYSLEKGCEMNNPWVCVFTAICLNACVHLTVFCRSELYLIKPFGISSFIKNKKILLRLYFIAIAICKNNIIYGMFSHLPNQTCVCGGGGRLKG